MPTEPLHIHIGEHDILIDGEPIPWWIKANVKIELLPQSHDGSSSGAIVFIGIYAHDVTVDPEANFVSVVQDAGCLGPHPTVTREGYEEDSCPDVIDGLERWEASNVRPVAEA